MWRIPFLTCKFFEHIILEVCVTTRARPVKLVFYMEILVVQLWQRVWDYVLWKSYTFTYDYMSYTTISLNFIELAVLYNVKTDCTVDKSANQMSLLFTIMHVCIKMCFVSWLQYQDFECIGFRQFSSQCIIHDLPKQFVKCIHGWVGGYLKCVH